ncbi:hypothetical protein GCM10023331_21260 [Algivirga pacifica]|uniref:SPOR domain-containing protein n=2 Tax=Algivirga pacifica TaxID=1162670 RepID=A0ABP9DAS8_9BACT
MIVRVGTMLLLFTSCISEGQFNEIEPFSILVGQSRDWEVAESLKQRLLEEGVPAYVICVDQPKEGKWYKVLTGAFDSIDEVLYIKREYTDRLGITSLEVANYSKQTEHVIPYDVDVLREEKKKQIQLEQSLEELCRQIPMTPFMSLEHFTLIVPGDEEHYREIPTMKRMDLRLPRGVRLKDIAESVDKMLVASMKDRLTGHSYDIHLFKGNENELKLSKIIIRILNSGSHSFEKTEKFTVKGSITWDGYLVVVSPRPYEYKRYLLLANKRHNYYALIQHSSSDINKMKGIVKKMGGLESILSQKVVTDFFNMVPYQGGGTLIGIDIRKLNNVKGRYGAYFDGHYQGIAVIDQQEKGIWESKLTRFNDEKYAQKIFENLYDVETKQPKDNVYIGGKEAFITYSMRKGGDENTYRLKPNDLQFYSKYIFGEISNKRRALLEKEDMIKQLKSMPMFNDVKIETITQSVDL